MSRTVLRAVWTYKISLRFPSCFQTFRQSMLAVVGGDYLKLNEINPIRKALGSFCYSVVKSLQGYCNHHEFGQA